MVRRTFFILDVDRQTWSLSTGEVHAGICSCLLVHLDDSDSNKSCETSPHRWVRAMNHSFIAGSGCQLWTWRPKGLAWSYLTAGNERMSHTDGMGSASLSSFIPILSSISLTSRASRQLVPPPTNPSILMLVHIGLGHIKPMINDVLIGLFSTTQPRCWVDSTLAYLRHPACQRRMFPAGLIKGWYILEGWDTFVPFCFPAEHSDRHQHEGGCDRCVSFPVSRKSFFSNYWANPGIVTETLRIIQVSMNEIWKNVNLFF